MLTVRIESYHGSRYATEQQLPSSGLVPDYSTVKMIFAQERAPNC